MDEATSRTRSASRRMASAKPAATTQRSSSSKSTKANDDPDISPARWAGVALVIAAIVGAIILAVASPSDPAGETPIAGVTTRPTPTPAATVLDTRLPAAVPRIISPDGGLTREIYVAVTVDLPEEELPNKRLKLVILRGEEEVGYLEKLKTGSKVVVEGVTLVPGQNELTAALQGPGGLGPRSEPVFVTSDRDATELAITSPENKYDTYEDTVEVSGTSEVGAQVRIRNGANNHKDSMVVGESGKFAFTVPLKKGTNRIETISVDSAGNDQDATVRVKRLNGKPTVKVSAPKQVSKSSLPREIVVTVDVKDAGGKKMEGAEVYYSLGGQGRITTTESLFTNRNGRSTWRPAIEPSTSPVEAVELSVFVTSPVSGEKSNVERRTIAID